MRLDLYLRNKFPEKTRAAWQRVIKNGLIKVNGAVLKRPHAQVAEEAFVEVALENKKGNKKPESQEKISESPISKLPFKILFKDDSLLAIEKPPGIATSPPDKNATVAELLSPSGRKFIKPLHRLDKDTSGVLLFAKSEKAHAAVSAAWKARHVSKTYIALVKGTIETRKGLIEAPIHRSLKDRKKMAVSSRNQSREAFTEFALVKTFKISAGSAVTLLHAFPKTGRTHQIRVHFAAIGHPVIGDAVYGDVKLNKKFEQLYGLHRQFLHAAELTITHPKTKKSITFISKLPPDLAVVLKNLKSLSEK